jgi:hypothetical protein
MEVAKARLVTIIGSSEFADRIADTLRSLGAGGYTRADVSGHGLHGPRKINAFDSGNVRIETIVRPAVAEKILEYVAKEYGGCEIAFAHDVDAVPRSHFE